MNTPKNVNPITVLDSLSPASQQALDRHFEAKYRTAILASITSQLGKKVVVSDAADENTDETTATPKKRGPKAKATVEAPAKRGGKRGPGRPKLSAAEKTRRAAERAAAKDEAAPKKRGPKAKRGPGSLGLTAKGQTASEVIREYDTKHPDVPASEVVAHCKKLGLKRVSPANVYNVRQLVKKAAAASKGKRGRKASK